MTSDSLSLLRTGYQDGLGTVNTKTGDASIVPWSCSQLLFGQHEVLLGGGYAISA
jgi:hypothetical protein